MPDDKGRKYLTAAEVAEHFRLTRAKVYQMVARGEIRALRSATPVAYPARR